MDKQLVQETRTQIRGLIQEITDLAKSDCSVEEFHEGFLMRTTSALASVGGAVWIKDPEHNRLRLHYQINLNQTDLATNQDAQKQHSLLLTKLLETAQPTLVPPNSGSEPDEAGNPTDFLLVIAPLIVDKQPVGLVEILQRPGAGPTTQRGYLRFLNQMCTIASDFLKDRRLESFKAQETMWQKVEQYIKAVHGGLNPTATAYTIANEGRRLVDCDRVSVALASGSRMNVKAVSGLDTIERRAEQVKLLSRLTTAVCKAGEELWYSGDSSNLPPQIETKLHEYIDKSHSKMLAIIPLIDQPESEDSENKNTNDSNKLGALIIEQMVDARLDESTQNRVNVVRDHGQSALANAIEHHSVFLMPVWKALGKLLAPFRRSNLPKTAMVIGVITVMIMGLWFFPWSFSLTCNGQLIPVHKKEIFARLDGTLETISVPNDPYATIDANTVLATMTNNDLMVEIEELEGELNQAKADYRKFARAESERMDNKLDEILLAYERTRAQKKIEGLEKALTYKKEQAQHLQVRSPIQGQVVNWQPRRTLLGRPVSRGQNLMTVVAPDTPWEVELEMPEKRVGHLLRADADLDELSVLFSLVSDPGSEFTGQVIEINRNLEVKSDDGNTVTITVQFDNQQIAKEYLRAGTRVRAKVQCGSRSLGYVLFHELIETTKTNWNYWF